MNDPEEVSLQTFREAIHSRNWTEVRQKLNGPDIFDLVLCGQHQGSDILFVLCERNAPKDILMSFYHIHQHLALDINHKALFKMAINGGGSDLMFEFLLDAGEDA